MKYVATIDGDDYVVQVDESDQITVNEAPRTVHLESIRDGSVYALLVDVKPYEVFVESTGDGYAVTVDGDRFDVSVTGERRERGSRSAGSRASGPSIEEPTEAAEAVEVVAAEGSTLVRSPLTGILVELLVEVGHDVDAGQSLAVLEAMKMQNDIKAPCAGRIETVHCGVGDALGTDDVMMCIVSD